MSQLEALRPALDAALLAVSYYAEPGALRLYTTSEIAADPDDADRNLGALMARLGQKSSLLAAVLPAATPPATATEARAERNRLIDALKEALDRDALQILPPIERVPATTPLVASGTATVASALADWKPVRAKLARVTSLFSEGGWGAYSTSDASTAADDADTDERGDEGIAPRARLFGTFVSHLPIFKVSIGQPMSLNSCPVRSTFVAAFSNGVIAGSISRLGSADVSK
jgi:hypothetical protein